jgi:3-mercaptopyruvate sulfurtransferase SseA
LEAVNEFCLEIKTSDCASSELQLATEYLTWYIPLAVLFEYFNLSFAKKLRKAAPNTQHLDKATQIAGQESLNLPGS